MERISKMHIHLSSGGLSFPKEELEREITLRGNIQIASKEEAMDSLRKTTGFSVVGHLSSSLTEEMVGRNGETVYVVRLSPQQYCFSLPCGKVVHKHL